jgi:hypothetical protein
MDLKFGGRRADTKGYLEFIWIENGTVNPQAIALITDVCTPKKYAASYGTWTCQGNSVAEVKEQLFDKIRFDLGA